MKTLKQNDVKEFLELNNLYDDNTYFIVATIGTSYFILSFCDKGIYLLPVEPTGDLSGDIDLLEKDDIETLEIKKKLFGYKLIVESKDPNLGKAKFTVRPFMIGYKGQKENLENILKIYF